MAQAAKKRGIKSSVRDTASKVKSYASKKVEAVKNYGRKYKADSVTAYDIGYASGWADANRIPARVGSETLAAFGYKKGIRNSRRTDTYSKQYNKSKGAKK